MTPSRMSSLQVAKSGQATVNLKNVNVNVKVLQNLGQNETLLQTVFISNILLVVSGTGLPST
jgi:hypothetical protein